MPFAPAPSRDCCRLAYLNHREGLRGCSQGAALCIRGEAAIVHAVANQ